MMPEVRFRPLEGVEITGPLSPAYADILTAEAVHFLARLARAFTGRRDELLRRRVERQAAIEAGQLPDFLPETADIRAAEWRVAPIPPTCWTGG